MTALQNSRPDWDEYYMSIAMAVRARANCMGNHWMREAYAIDRDAIFLDLIQKFENAPS